MATTYFLSMASVLGGAERVGMQIADILGNTFNGKSLINYALKPHVTLTKTSVTWMKIPHSMVKIARNPLAILYYLLTSLWFIARHRPARGTIFYCNDLESVFFAMAAKLFTSGWIVWHVHDVYKVEKRSTRIILGLVSLVTDVLVCLTTHNAERMESIFRCRIEVIPNFCRLTPIKAPKARAYKEGGVINFGYLGQITRWKRVDAAIRLVRTLNDEYGIKLRLKIGGIPLYDSDQSYKEELLQLVGNANYIEWMGAVIDPISFFSELDYLLTLSDNEPFGLVIVEAFSQGIPVISSNGDGPNEIINEYSGLIFNNIDSRSFYYLGNKIKEITNIEYNKMSSYCIDEAIIKYSVESFSNRIIKVVNSF